LPSIGSGRSVEPRVAILDGCVEAHGHSVPEGHEHDETARAADVSAPARRLFFGDDAREERPKPAQTFGTTIFFGTGLPTVKTLMVPTASIRPEAQVLNAEQRVNAFGFLPFLLVTPENIGPLLSEYLAAAYFAREELFNRRAYPLPTQLALLDPDEAKVIHATAASLLRDELIPVRVNPLNLESIGRLVTHATGTAIGAYAGFVMAGPSPVLLITIPAGMILVGAAAGTARALEEGLYKRLLPMISGAPTRRPRR
jgi:hypothetical protein